MISNHGYNEVSEQPSEIQNTGLLSLIKTEHVLEEIERTEQQNLKYDPDGNLLRFWSSISSYMEYGPVYTQFFWFIRYNIILLLFCVAVFAGILLMTGNIEKIFKGPEGFALISHETKLLLITVWACIGILFGFCGIFTARFSRDLAKSPKLFPADFSIEIWRLPETISEQELKEFVLDICPNANILKTILVETSLNCSEGQSKRFTGSAFITFETQKDRDTALKSFHADNGLVWEFFMSKIRIGNRVPLVSIPNDTDDITPENYGYRQIEIFSQRMKTYFIILVGIIGCFACQYILKEIQGEKSPNLLTAVLVLILNVILLIIAKRAFLLIKFCSQTLLQGEIAWAAAALHFINIVFLPILVQFLYSRNTGSTINAALIKEVALNGLIQTTVPFVLSLINPVFLIRAIIRRRKRAKAKSGTLLTEKEIRKYFLYDNFDLSMLYGRVMAILMFTFFIGLFLPLSFACATVGLIIGDIAMRLRFIKQTRRPERRSSGGLARKINFIFFLYPLLTDVGIRMFVERFVYDQSDVEMYVIDRYFLVAGVIILIVGGIIGERIFRVVLWKPHQEVTYQEASIKYPENFKADYETLFSLSSLDRIS